jgi:release factor glutamine methyltransferase
MVEAVVGSAGADGRRPVSDPDRARLDRLAERRRAGEPLQYILGEWAFRTLDLIVDTRALVPRPETEQVVEVALGELRRVAGGTADPVVVDLGTGSGAIALSVAVEAGPSRPGLRVVATDVDRDALDLAAANRDRVAARHPRVAGAVEFRAGSWYEALPDELRGRVHVIVSNPPYVAEGEWGGLPEDVRREPRIALVAPPSSDGTPGGSAVESVLTGAPAWLARPGAVVVEIAPHQAGPCAAMARRAGFETVAVVADLAGRDRALVGRIG